MLNVNDRKILEQAKELVLKMRDLLEKKSTYQKKSQFDKFEEMISKVTELCNQYYELIPRKEFAYDKLNLILHDYQCNQELSMIDEVFDLDIALKMIYGAYLNAT